MKPGLVAFFLIAATIGAQRVLALPQAPVLAAAVLLPMPWVVGPPLMSNDRRWYAMSFVLGLLWDALFEPVIGPGAISWSSAAAVSWGLGSLVVNRGPRAWFAFGIVASFAFWAARTLSQALLGLHLAPRPSWVVLSTILSAILCGFVGWLIWFDIPRYWRSLRARRLR